jgi:hypothetical protein
MEEEEDNSRKKMGKRFQSKAIKKNFEKRGEYRERRLFILLSKENRRGQSFRHNTYLPPPPASHYIYIYISPDAL